MKKRGQSQRRRRSNRINSSGAGGMTPVKQSDLRIKPPSLTNVPTSIPRNIQKSIAWDIVKINSLITSTGSPSTVETNYNFYFTLNPQYASWAALFDQYSIPLASITFDSMTPSGSTAPPPVLYTALDFDNNANLGSISAIEDFDTCEVTVMAPGKRVLRSVRPSSKIVVQQAGGSNIQAVTSGPTWSDTAQNNQNYYGIRSIAFFVPTGQTINVTMTLVFCFRSRI